LDILFVDEVDSTMSEAQRLLEAGHTPEFAVVAKRQTAGRGRLQRNWITPEGNLSLTITSPWQPGRADGSTIALITGLAVQKAVQAVVRDQAAVTIKWPNDVLIDGGKVCGILIEACVTVLNIGIGINIASRPEGVPYPTSCLRDVTGVLMSTADMAIGVLSYWEPLYKIWQAHGFAHLREEYNSCLHLLGQPARISLDRDKNRWIGGICRGVDASGCLLLEGKDGLCVAHAAGDMEFLRSEGESSRAQATVVGLDP
jgi:BirA family biotin operon repressor/biotin-[acetyl-CoA-carboxylase] ligase